MILPRIVQGAILTFGLLRTRLYFPDLLLRHKESLSFSSANQRGGGAATPLFRKNLPG